MVGRVEGRVRRASLALFLLTITLLSIPLTSIKPADALTVTWGPLQRLTKSLTFDFLPQVIQTKDQKVWLFWESVNFFKPNPDIHYKTWDWSSWPGLNGNLSAGGSPEQTLPGSTTSQETAPKAVQMANGTLFVSFASNRTGNFDIYLKRYNSASGWSADYQLTSNAQLEGQSSLVAARDGSLWVYWNREDPATGVSNLYYKKYIPSTGWTGETSLTSDAAPYRNREPAAYQMRDGRIWLFWSQVQDTGFSKIYLYYRIFDGTIWQPRVQFTSTNNPDRSPAIAQDANATMWLLWSRELPLSGSCTQQDLFYRYSTTNGVSWSAETAIMDDGPISQCNNDIAPDDSSPSLAQLRDFKVWLFWHSNRDPENWWDLYYTSTNAFPVHDVSVDSVTDTPVLLRKGGQVTIAVTISDPGAYAETLQLTVTATNTTTITIATQTAALQSGQSASYTFTWSTSNVNPAWYRITASLQAVPGESTGSQSNNSLDGAKVHVIPPGDVNYDGKVTIIDAALVGYAYGTHPGDPLWNPDADLDYNGRIDILDAAIVAFWYGATS